NGLQPATTYWYRFGLAGAWSRVGRTRTAPAYDADLASLRLGVVPCSNWEGGYFAAYRHLAARGDLDAVHLGDYIYEYKTGEFGGRAGGAPEPAGERDHHARGLPDPARELQDRSGSAGAARVRSVDHHLGRPRGRQRRLVRRCPEPRPGHRGQLGRPGRGGPPGVRRVDAGTARRGRGDLPAAALRPAARPAHAGPAHVPVATGVRHSRG